MNAAAQRVLARLPNAKLTADGWKDRCPECGKTLTVVETTGIPFIRCEQHGHWSQILAKLGLTPDDLVLRADEPAGEPTPLPVPRLELVAPAPSTRNTPPPASTPSSPPPRADHVGDHQQRPSASSPGSASSPSAGPRFRIFSDVELDELPDLEWDVTGVVPSRALMAIIGLWESGKTAVSRTGLPVGFGNH
jgi:hypothetical protein